MKKPFEQQPVDNPSGGRSLLDWNLHMWEHVADPRRSMRIEVSWDLRQPTPAGMPNERESHELEDLQLTLASLLKRKADALYALRVTGDGKQVHVFYAPPRVGLLRKRPLAEVVEPALKKFGSSYRHDVQVEFIEDAEWTRLFGIYSSHDPKQWHTDRALLLAMIKERDAVFAKRPVWHRAHFDDRDDCRAYLQGARKLRFKSEGGPKETKAGAPGAWVGTVVRKEPTLVTWHIHPVALSLKELATRNKGIYDGWQADVIRRKDPEPLAPPGGVKVG